MYEAQNEVNRVISDVMRCVQYAYLNALKVQSYLFINVLKCIVMNDKLHHST